MVVQIIFQTSLLIGIGIFIHSKKIRNQCILFLITYLFSLIIYVVPALAQQLLMFAVLLLLIIYLLFAVFIEVISKLFLHYEVNECHNLRMDNCKILIFVPHEDDEINIAGGILEMINTNDNVYVVLFTTGDAADDNGKERMRETLSALAQCGVKDKNIIFMGYGNRWNGEYTHIYHAPINLVMESAAGYHSTYALPNHLPYREKAYTRNNILDDLCEILQEFKPDIIMTNDCDWHQDHRALSLFLDEAVGLCVHKSADYRPIYLKTFAYDLAWSSKQDFYSVNLLNSQLPENSQGIFFFKWDERIRFPVFSKGLSRNLEQCKLYKVLKTYSSQLAERAASQVINSDKCFWQRRTDNLLLNQNVDISVTSGEKGYLNDFKIVDYYNISDRNAIPDAIGWRVDEDDFQCEIRIDFSTVQSIKQIVIYECHFDVKRRENVIICSGEDELPIIVKFGERNIYQVSLETKSIIFKLETRSQICISEIEIYDRIKQTLPFEILKVTDEQGKYVYDCWCDTLEERAFHVENGQGEIVSNGLSFHIEPKENGWIDEDGTAHLKARKRGKVYLYVEKEHTLTDHISLTYITTFKKLFYFLMKQMQLKGLSIGSQILYYKKMLVGVLVLLGKKSK